MKPITDYKFTPGLLTEKAFWWNCRTKEEFAKLPQQENDFDALLAIVQNNKKLFSLIMSTVPTLGGWCSPLKACAMASLTLAIKPSQVIELGVWNGRSLLPVAFALKELGSGIIVGIDPYSPQASASGQMGADEEWWGKQDHKAIRDNFKQLVARFKVEAQVRLIEKASDDVDTKGLKIQMLHSDGNHGDQALRDAEKYAPLVEMGGFVINDDIFWAAGAVLRAIDTLEDLGFVEVFRRSEGSEHWNIMQRRK